jgi:hypothetical protein
VMQQVSPFFLLRSLSLRLLQSIIVIDNRRLHGVIVYKRRGALLFDDDMSGFINRRRLRSVYRQMISSS